jgi:hypothetical protein
MSTLREVIHENVRDGELYEKLDRNWVRCFACGHCCKIPELRAMRLKEIAARVKDEFGRDLRAALVGPIAECARYSRNFQISPIPAPTAYCSLRASRPWVPFPPTART